MKPVLTRVDLLFRSGRVNDRLRFGKPVAKLIMDRTQTHLWFAPGSLFCCIHWRANRHGTTHWRVIVARTCRPGQHAVRLPSIHPGAEPMLDVSGKAKVRKALALIDAMESAGIDPTHVSTDWYRHAHNRLLTGLGIAPTTPEKPPQ